MIGTDDDLAPEAEKPAQTSTDGSGGGHSQQCLPTGGSAPAASPDAKFGGDPQAEEIETGEVPAGGSDGCSRIVGSGIWSQQTIRKRQDVSDGKALLWDDPETRTELDETRLDPAGYRLTMGPESTSLLGRPRRRQASNLLRRARRSSSRQANSPFC